MSTFEALAITVVVCSIGLTVLIALIFLRTIARVLSHADSVHDRGARQLDSALDRLMANDFATFKTYQAAEDAPFGEYIAPEEPEEEPELVSKGGFGSSLGLSALLHRRQGEENLSETLGPVPKFTE